MKNFKALIFTIVFALIYYYLMLPPINLSSPFFYFSLYVVIGFYLLISGMLNLSNYGRFNASGVFVRNKEYVKNKYLVKILMLLSAGLVLIFVINLFYSPVFRSNVYSKRINIIEGSEFTLDVAPVNFNKLALLDKDSSRKLGDRVMGQMPDLVSQFDVSDIYTQINYGEDIERLTPLEYADVFKYLSNRKEGIGGYIKVDSVTGASSLVRLDEGMKYVPSALLNENLHRRLRFDYPFDVFGVITFEIDEEGNPHWIVPVIKYKGIGRLKEIESIIIFDPVTGDSDKYSAESVPTWVDHVYDSNLIVEQVNDWGMYKNGFFNSIFGQKGVVATTEGYNYVVMNDDVYMTTGITSAVRDESNIGFILTNLRTKETKLYEVPGAEEYSAMASAEGQVQQMNYTATFPILINLNNKPTYIISLKDNAGLVKMFAFVDLVDYQKVVVSDSSEGIEKAAANYLDGAIDTTKENVKKTIEVKRVTSMMIGGNTYLYITDKDDKNYKVSIKINESLLPFVKVNDKLNVTYIESDLNEIIKIER